MDVREMERGAESPGQGLRSFDRQDRQVREIDWNKNISNSESFHALKMGRHREMGSPWFAKSRSFFARLIDVFSAAVCAIYAAQKTNADKQSFLGSG